MANKPATAEIYKKQFCRGEFSQCARYTVFKKLGRDAVPSDLFPNMIERALEVIKAAS
jgi:hypothetical protein